MCMKNICKIVTIDWNYMKENQGFLDLWMVQIMEIPNNPKYGYQWVPPPPIELNSVYNITK